jgi:hypothetical protein
MADCDYNMVTLCAGVSRHPHKGRVLICFKMACISKKVMGELGHGSALRGEAAGETCHKCGLELVAWQYIR